MTINDKSDIKPYNPSNSRYDKMKYNRSGNSGVLLPAISLGLWNNFGSVDSSFNARQILRVAFDLGITHFDLANNYGPPYGSAEENFGNIFNKDFKSHRDELFLSTKAGYDMWPGPYGNWGSRKYLIASIDQSLKRMKQDYVDVFYHHRPDPNTPLEETMAALSDIVKQGKALYIGISNYHPEETTKAAKILKDLKVPCLIHQARYSILDRWVEDGLLQTLEDEKIGCIAFSPLAQGQLTDKYLEKIPSNSRAAKTNTPLDVATVNDNLQKTHKLNAIADQRGQKLSQMAISWLLSQTQITSVLVGASSPEQLKENTLAIDNCEFSIEERKLIDDISN